MSLIYFCADRIHNHLCQTQFKPNTKVKGTSCMMLMDYYDWDRNGLSKKLKSITPVQLLGEEEAGSYAGQFNMIGGVQEGNCPYCNMKKEFREETGFNVEDLCINTVETAKTFFVKSSLIFILYLKSGTSRGCINPVIARNNADLTLPWCYREMACVDFFKLEDNTQLERKYASVSVYVKDTMERYKELKRQRKL